MEAKVNLVAVGAFVLALGTALVAGVLWLSSPKSYRKAYDIYVVYMSESVSGLSVDAPVRYRGVPVGAVRRIALAPGNVEQVELTLDIERGTPVKEDTVAALRTQGLTGIAHIELSGGSQAARILAARADEPHPVIRAAPSFLQRLDTEVSGLIAAVSRSSESLNAALAEDNRRALAATLANVEALSRTLAASSGALDQAIAGLPELVARTQRAAQAVERMAGETARAAADTSAAMDSVRADARQFGELLPEAQALIAELRELTASLRRVSGELERNPAVLLHGRPPAKPGPGE
jgi:phospholipid/cholesterol/gamma-HCH transport system substrate-binding protein